MSKAPVLKKMMVIALLVSGMSVCSYAQKPQAPAVGKEKYSNSKQIEDEIGFTHAIKVGDHLYLSGVVAVGDMQDQVKEIMETIKRTLTKYNAGFSSVIKETVYTTDINEFKKYRSVRNSYYNGDYPAATWVEVKQLYLPQYKVSIEIEAIVGNNL